MPYLTASDGCRIFHETFGENGPLVMLIPGLGGDGRFWTGVVDRLRRKFRLLVVDHRGAGRSDRPDNGYSIGQIAQDCADIAATTGEPMHIVGHSTGGAIAQTLALDHANTALSFTISSSWARSDQRFINLFAARAMLLDGGLAEAYQRLTHVLGHEPGYLEQHFERLDAAANQAAETLSPLSVAARRVRMLLDFDRLDDLPNIKARTLVLAANDDILTPPYLSRQVAEAIPDARFTMLEGAHFHPLARPEQFAGVVEKFIADTHHDH